MKVVVLSCGPLGYEISNRLHELDEVAAVTLVHADYRRKALTPLGKFKHVIRYQGWGGLFGVLLAKLRPSRSTAENADSDPSLNDGVGFRHFTDFHEPDCLAYLDELGADLGILAGTYILEESVFGRPGMGCINLHTGKAPEYRGAAPAFWEVYNGETEIGVTVHEVTADLDAGRILAQETFPLDPAPAGDPMDYVMKTRSDVLLPNGVRMIVEGVRSLADGSAEWTTQDPTNARTYRTPDYAAIRELRRRVADRRRRAAAR